MDESIPYGPASRRFLPLNWNKGDGKLLCIAQFNVLAGNLASPSHFPYVKPELLEWHARRCTLLDEIRAICDAGSLDIIGCEELSSYWEFWKYAMRDSGFDSVFAKRPSITPSSWSGLEKHDGCGIFFRAERFRLLKEKTLIFHDTHDRCALLLVLYDRTLDRSFIVGSTHLYWDAAKEDTQLAELAELESGVQALITWTLGQGLYAERAAVPVLLCGDFNNGPCSRVYAHVTGRFGTVCADWYNGGGEGTDGRDRVVLRSAYDQYMPMVERDGIEEGACEVVYGPEHEPPYTTANYKRKWTIDFIFYSPVTLAVSALYEIPLLSALRSEDGPAGWIEAVNASTRDRGGLTFLSEDDNNNGIPNSRFGSDHVPIAAVFRMVD